MFREFGSNETVPAKSEEFGTAKPETPTARVRPALLRPRVQEDEANWNKGGTASIVMPHLSEVLSLGVQRSTFNVVNVQLMVMVR